MTDPKPDDPRVSMLGAEIERARGDTYYWLMWSGGLLGDGDAASEATALVRRRWWHFNGDFNIETELFEVNEQSAAEVLSWLMGNTMAYDTELMKPELASAFTANFITLIPRPRRWFTNGDGFPSSQYSFNPATDFTFDMGVVAVADGRAWIAWFKDED
jgi:hypothetical protein